MEESDSFSKATKLPVKSDDSIAHFEPAVIEQISHITPNKEEVVSKYEVKRITKDMSLLPVKMLLETGEVSKDREEEVCILNFTMNL